MGQTVYALFDGELPSKAALTRCFEELGFPLAFERGTSPLHDFPGRIWMRLRGEEARVNFFKLIDLDEFESQEGFEARFTRGVGFNFFADDLASAIAICLATALVKLTNGAIFHSDFDGSVSLERALRWARHEVESTEQQEVARPTTRRQDLRPYLKSLLKQRSDLALAGRSLFIRPVRHVLRYAYFEPTFDRYVVRVLRKCVPLFSCGPSTRHYVDHLKFEVWQPHFEPMLIDSLAHDVFDEVGKITTLSDLAVVQPDGFGTFPRITSLILAGEQDRALATVEEIERANPVDGRAMHPAREHWERVSKDIKATCAECHAEEVRAVKAMKLQRFWEPSPFPVELPRVGRTVSVSEPAFTTTPWPERPSWLWQDVPPRPGEIRYAKDFVRHGGLRLLVALTREEAEERHREWERYALAARLPDGLLVLMYRLTFWDRLHPQDRDRVEREEPSVHIVLDGGSHIAGGTIEPDKDDPGLARFEDFSAYPRSGKSLEWRLDFKNGTKAIRDDRGGDTVLDERPLAAAERDLATVPKPAFGEYEPFAEHLRALLRMAGYGEIS
jgi:hypothetical protein